MLKPAYGFWFFLIALLPWALRLLAGNFPFQRTALDWLVAIFLITAWVGYWAAYDKAPAWSKVWLIVTAVLLYYAFNAQPKENLIYISALFFCMGVGMSMFYFMTYDFINAPRKLELVNQIGRWFMSVRPQIGLNSIHPNYVAGIVAITTPFIFYPLWKLRERRLVLLYMIVFIGLCLAGFAVLMATSRGVIMAIASGVGAWFLWRFIPLNRIKHRLGGEAVFPVIILIYVCAIIVFLYVGPANSGSVSAGYHYGNGGRAELFSRSLYLAQDYPFTGGGLGAFPALYSQYILDIPFFNVPNSHNLFLDVAIEQGAFGALAFLCMYVAALWLVARSLMQETTDEELILKWLVFFALIVAVVHGMVDDYLYNGNGSLFSLCLVGLSVYVSRKNNNEQRQRNIFAIGFVALLIIGAIFIGSNKILAVWYADIGAVQMAQVELDGFPNNGWVGSEIVPRLEIADATLHSALQFDPANRTANQRLGMIALLQADFESADGYLQTANQQSPAHRGILKTLGYSYVWHGDVEQALPFLSQIPEAREELDAYRGWWSARGRNDLSDNAALAISKLSANPAQP